MLVMDRSVTVYELGSCFLVAVAVSLPQYVKCTTAEVASEIESLCAAGAWVKTRTMLCRRGRPATVRLTAQCSTVRIPCHSA